MGHVDVSPLVPVSFDGGVIESSMLSDDDSEMIEDSDVEEDDDVIGDSGECGDGDLLMGQKKMQETLQDDELDSLSERDAKLLVFF